MREPTAAAAARRKFTLWLCAIASTVALLVTAAGVLYFRNQRDKLRVSIWRELESIADLKVRQLAEWRSERLNDARFLMQTTAISRDVAALLEKPNSTEALASVRDWLTSIKGGERYESILLLDRESQVRVAIPPDAPKPRVPLRGAVSEVFSSGQFMLTDLHQPEPHEAAHLDLIAPITANAEAGGSAGQSRGSPVAVVVLRLAPERFIFPLLQDWPSHGTSAETVLVRREGDDVVYLNDLKYAEHAALRLRRNVHEPLLAGAMAVRGETGVREGVDYRGVPVLASTRAVPDTGWSLIAKIDQAEAYASIRHEAWTVAAMVAFVLGGLAAVAAQLWRLQNEQVLRRTLAAEQEARVLAERLALLSRYANDIIVLADETTRILEVNECATATYGYTAEEMRTMKMTDLRPPESRAVDGDEFTGARGASGTVFETVHQRKNGTHFHVEVSARFVLLGGRSYLLCVLRDVSERKRSEVALRESEARFRSAIEKAPDAVFIQVHGRFAYLNEATLRLFRAPDVEALLGKPVLERFAPEVREEVAERIRQLDEERQAVGLLEVVCLRLDGAIVHAEVSSVPFTFGGQPASLVFARDITGRVDAEKALRASEERYRSVFQNNYAIMVLIDADDGRIVDANPAAARFYGWSRGQLQQMNISQINALSPEELRLEMRRAREALQHHFHFRHRRFDGAVREVEVFSSPLVIGNRTLLFSIIHDITDRKTAEAALAAQVDELQRWRAVTLGRETRVLELKAEINRLLEAAGQPPRYASVAANGAVHGQP